MKRESGGSNLGKGSRRRVPPSRWLLILGIVLAFLLPVPVKTYGKYLGPLKRSVRGSPPCCTDDLRGGEAAASQDYLFGVINDIGSHYGDEWDRGIRATTLELHWEMYEPQEGAYDLAYINHLKDLMRGLKNQGWAVQLVPGYHYVPEWVFTNYPDTYYINQFGEKYDPDPISEGDFRVINAPFNPQARDLIAGYISRIFQDFDQTDPLLRFDSVRVGGGVQGELRYPPKNWNGHSNSYWAFDHYAQDPTISGIPASVVNWRPGIEPNPGSVGHGQLIVNPGFEDTNPNYATFAWSPDDEVVAQIIQSDPHAGARALQLALSAPNRVHQYVRVEPNTAYEFGGWLKSENGGGLARIFLVQYDNDSQLISAAPFAKLESNGTSWSYREGSIQTSPATRFLKIELDGDRPGVYYFDDLWLKKEGELDHRNRQIDIPAAFYDWYVQTMTAYQAWQISEIRDHFDGQLDLTYAGKGIRPNQITDALTNDLRGDGWSESLRSLYSGADYSRHVAGLDLSAPVALYLTGIDEPAGSEVDDTSPYPGDWSAARWMAHLANREGLPLWGENSGQDDLEKMALTFARMQANDFIGLMWGFESELYASPNPSGYATIDDYEALISFYQALLKIYLPVLYSVKYPP